MSNHTAIILIALGGPRSLDDVGPFMAAFMGRPAPPALVAAVAERYQLIGGRSPLPDLVKAQAAALEKELGKDYRAYEGFRYSRPTIEDAYDRAVTEGADRYIAISMSPFGTEVTTGAYQNVCQGLGDEYTCPLFIPSWHDNRLFIEAWKEKVREGLQRFSDSHRRKAVVLFTSHSIPRRYIEAGDPYQQQVEETIGFIVKALGLEQWRIAWQSKGAQAKEPWIEPAVEPTLDTLAAEGFTSILEVPVGFTCDHMETLYDIDIVHRKHTESLGLTFERAESLNTSPTFIKALADIARKA